MIITKCICLEPILLGINSRCVTEKHKIYDYWIHENEIFYVIQIDGYKKQYPVDTTTFQKNFISLDKWREQQINNILEDL